MSDNSDKDEPNDLKDRDCGIDGRDNGGSGGGGASRWF